MLSSTDIVNLLGDSVIIEPFNVEQLNINSYDLRLGNLFYNVYYIENAPCYVGPIFIEDGNQVKIPVGGTLLGMTKEVAGGQYNIVPEIRAKSTTRRSGITICDDAGFGDIGYINHWTVELTAHIKHGTPSLVVGERFAQIVFFRSSFPIYEYKGQYAKNDWPICMIPKKYRNNIISVEEWEKINAAL